MIRAEIVKDKDGPSGIEVEFGGEMGNILIEMEALLDDLLQMTAGIDSEGRKAALTDMMRIMDGARIKAHREFLIEVIGMTEEEITELEKLGMKAAARGESPWKVNKRARQIAKKAGERYEKRMEAKALTAEEALAEMIEKGEMNIRKENENG